MTSPTNPQPDEIERVARAICLAGCVGNQGPDDPMGVLHLAKGVEYTPPYRWQLHTRQATAAIAAMDTRLREQIAAKDAVIVVLRSALERICMKDGNRLFHSERDIVAIARAALTNTSATRGFQASTLEGGEQ